MSPLDLANTVIVFWLCAGFLGLAARHRPFLITHVLFPVGTLGALVLAAAGLWGLGETQPDVLVLPLGLPTLPFHLRLDTLAAFFLLVLGGTSTGISLFASGYIRHLPPAKLGLLCMQYHAFLAALALVLIADDAYLFMVAWESMTLTSYFLVTTDHGIGETRRAGYLYLLIAHIGALAILLCFGVMHGDYTFASMRSGTLAPFWSSAVFLLALFGFGAKAGLVPLHVWLPEAHPAAPSPVSALMSAVMLKTALYGLLRVTFDLLPSTLWWWGVVVLALGLLSALFGVIFAAAQTDMKRLLAYSSIENIGIIFAALGLAIIFYSYDMRALAALAFTAALYHTLNHAFFKSLLFCNTGAVLHATGERNLGKLGGLIHRMPWVAWLSLVGVLAMAGLPPLNGFVSEWLLLQAFLLTPSLPQPYLNMLIPVAAGALVLASAASAYVMVKFYGIIFLGQARAEKLKVVHDAGLWERHGLLWLATGCFILGLAPVSIIRTIDQVTVPLIGYSLSNSAAQGGWLFLTPLGQERASYSPLIFLIVIVALVVLIFVAVRRLYHGRARRSAAWDCGFSAQTPRMQDTAEGFGQPIHQLFEPFFRIQRILPGAFDTHPHYKKISEDRFWYALYLPIARLVDWISGRASLLQHGHIYLYLLYSFITLLALLAFVQ